MNNLQLFENNLGVAILGSEYCSGYIDSLGKWNTGFYCTSSDETVNVFCCGSSTHKYCCTRKDQEMVHHEEMEGLTMLIGVMVGAFTALLLLTIVFCVYYKKKEPEKYRGSMYRLANPDSSDSRVTNTYSIRNGTSDSTTPLAPSLTGRPFQLYRQGMNHTLPHSLSHNNSFQVEEDCEDMHETDRKYGTLGRHTHEQPPAYHILPPASYLLIPQDTPDILSETKIQGDTAIPSLSQSMDNVNMVDTDKQEDDSCQSTKF